MEVSFVGMQTEKVSIKGRTHVNVIMHEDKQQLGDVVVTGYQRISRERSTAAFGFVDSGTADKTDAYGPDFFSGGASGWFAYEYKSE